MILRKRVLLFLCLTFTATSLLAQLKVEKQLIKPLNNDLNQEYQIIKIDPKSLLVVEGLYSYYNKTYRVNFTKYDSTLNVSWDSSIEVLSTYDLTLTAQDSTYAYFLFQKEHTTDFFITRIHLQDGYSVIFEGKLLTDMDLNYFEITGGKAIFGGEYNDRAVVEMFNFVDNASKVLPGLYSNHLEVEGISRLPGTDEFVVMIRNNKRCIFENYLYDYDGKLLSQYQISEKNAVPLTGKILELADKLPMMVGNYAENCSNYSSGLYVHDFRQPDQTRFYNFNTLDNYLNYLPNRRKEKIKNRISLKEEKGKEYKIRQRLLLHPVQETPEGWLVVAEIYYPEYNSSANTLSFGYRTYRMNGQTYNQFNFSHVFIGEFNRQGDIIWNNTFPLKNVRTNELNEVAQVTLHKDGYFLAYPDDGVIKTSFIEKATQEDTPLQSYNLRSIEQSERVLDIRSTNLMAWYGQNFLAYGNMRVVMPGSTSTQEVFFINLFSYADTTDAVNNASN